MKRKPLYIWSEAMWEAKTNGDGTLATALDPDSGELFYIAEAAISFVVFGPWTILGMLELHKLAWMSSK